MEDDLDLSPTPKLNTHGGARRGAGRKRKDYSPSEAQAEYEDAHARRISAEADMLSIKLHEKAAAYVSREAVQDATRTAYGSIHAAIAPIPSLLKRRPGLTPDVVAEVDKAVREALTDLANTLTDIAGAPIRAD